MEQQEQTASPFSGLGNIAEPASVELGKAKAKEAIAEKKLRSSVVAGESRNKILEAIATLRESEQAITRQGVQVVSGLSAHIVDDHLRNLLQEGRLTRLVAGVYELVTQYPPTRVISHILLPDGTSNTEIGDTVLILNPRERRMLGSVLMGDALAHTNIQTGRDFNAIASELATCMLLLRRSTAFQEELGAQLGVQSDPITKGLNDRLAAIAERLISSAYRA